MVNRGCGNLILSTHPRELVKLDGWSQMCSTGCRRHRCAHSGLSAASAHDDIANTETVPACILAVSLFEGTIRNGTGYLIDWIRDSNFALIQPLEFLFLDPSQRVLVALASLEPNNLLILGPSASKTSAMS